MSSQFSRFIVAGGVAAAINFFSRFLFSEFMSFEWAVTAAFFMGLSSGFIFNRLFVFADANNALRTQIAYYVLVNAFALLQTWFVSVYLASYLDGVIARTTAEACAHLVGICLPVLTSYLGHKYLTFK